MALRRGRMRERKKRAYAKPSLASEQAQSRSLSPHWSILDEMGEEQNSYLLVVY